MQNKYSILRPKAVALRKQGKTYAEISKILNTSIPESTFSYWFRGIILSKKQEKRINELIIKNIKIAQKKALLKNKENRQDYLLSVYNRISHLEDNIKNKDVAKIALAMLYLGEGFKTKRGAVIFGNSDPAVIKLFIKLLRYCYVIDEGKFRCTVQLRADQNIKKMEKFWQLTTKISSKQFYKARIDPRTIGKTTRKKSYNGVCRVEYFSADIYNEILKIIEVLTK